MYCKATAAQVESMRAGIVAVVETMVMRLVGEVQEGEPTLEGLERAVLGELHTLGNTLLATLCQLCVAPYAAPEVDCPCGGTAHYQRQREGQCKTLLGVVRVKRPYYLCTECHRGYCPLDRGLGFCAGSISSGLEALLALLGTEFSYGHAVEMVAQLSLVQVSASRCREATIALGEVLAEHDEQVRSAVWERGEEPPPASVAQDGFLPGAPLYVSADGVIVPTRESGWREQCVGAVYRTSPASASQTPDAVPAVRSQAATYVSELGSRPAFTELLWLEAHRRGLEDAQTLVFIGDGAHWLWQRAEELFPTAIQILDWYHATSYLHATAQALYPAQEPAHEVARRSWSEPLLAALWESRTTEVMAQLEPLATTCSAAREALHYFTTNHYRMDYRRYRSLGLQVGSGTIESACKHVIQARIKQAGMRWCIRNARTMGKLRARLRSHRWSETLALRPLPLRRYHKAIT